VVGCQTEEKRKVKLIVAMNLHGLSTLQTATLHEEEEYEEPVKVTKEQPAAAAAPAAEAAGAEAAVEAEPAPAAAAEAGTGEPALLWLHHFVPAVHCEVERHLICLVAYPQA